MALDMVDPQPMLVAFLVRYVLLPRECLPLIEINSSLQEELLTIYTAEFTEEELKQIVAFYQTPVGKKAIEKLPQLTAKAGQRGVARVQAHQAELQQMIEEEKNKKEKAN